MSGGVNLKHGYDTCLGCTPLLYSLNMRQPAVAEYLVRNGASITGTSCELWSTRGYTVFHYAASYGYSKLLRGLIDRSTQGYLDLDGPIHPIHLTAANDADCVEMIDDRYL